MLMLLYIFLFIHSVALEEVQLLWGRVRTIKALNVCGEMCMKELSISTIVCFDHLESIGTLDPTNELDVFCLHFVYIPRSNSHLTSWQKAWIKHLMRSEHNLTPEQLWTIGLQRIATSNNHIASEVFEVRFNFFSCMSCMTLCRGIFRMEISNLVLTGEDLCHMKTLMKWFPCTRRLLL